MKVFLSLLFVLSTKTYLMAMDPDAMEVDQAGQAQPKQEELEEAFNVSGSLTDAELTAMVNEGRQLLDSLKK